MLSNVTVRQAVRLAVGAAAASAGYVPAAMALDAGPNADAAAATPSASLEEVIVTGTRIRRTVDEATASPITIISSEAIAQSGYQTAGDLLALLPGVAGSATSPALNNGGGFGESNVELRGLDAKRTLVLVDGRRVGIVGGP